MRRCIVGAIAGLGLLGAAPVAADAHRTSWYWGERAAERSIEGRYSDVLMATCTGFGKRMRRVMYRHFECDVLLDDGTTELDVLHVLGRYRFKLVSVY